MKLVPFSTEYLQLRQALPFPLRDENGRLLLAAEQEIESATQLEALKLQPLFTGEHESVQWRKRLNLTVDTMVREGALLHNIARALPERGGAEPEKDAPSVSLITEIDTMVLQLDSLLRDIRPGADWLNRLRQLHAQATALAARRYDSCLYYLIYTSGHFVERYSTHHALLTMLIAAQTGSLLGWPEEEVEVLGLASLTMNTSMLKLQDMLAQYDGTPTPEMRRLIDLHPERSAQLLADGGLDDALWLDVVRRHHRPEDPAVPPQACEPATRLAALVRRVDIFGAKLSRRARRLPMSPVHAAREACLGVNGQPDALGGALLRSVGMYPPGSFVELASGELAIVISRGRRSNLPIVVSLVSASGLPLGEPALRDTVQTKHAVKASAKPASVKVRPPHERLLEMLRVIEVRARATALA